MLPHHRTADAADRPGKPEVAARVAVNPAVAKAQPIEKISCALGAGDFGVGPPQRIERVRVAAAHHNFAPLRREGRRGNIGTAEHVAIERLDGREKIGEEVEVALPAPAGQARERVVDAEQQSLLVEIGDQRMEIVAAGLHAAMLPLINAIDPDVDFGPARHGRRDLFTQEEVGLRAQWFGRVDRIVIGHCDQIHSASLQRFVYRQWLIVTFAADAAEPGYGAEPRVEGVDV